MSIVLDIVRSYTRPKEVLTRRLGGPAREDRALAVLLGGCGLMFVAQVPRLAREAHLDPSTPFDGRMAGALFGWLMLMPLVFYGLALLVHLVMRALGRAPNGFQVRMALFWALLASTPLWLLTGLMMGFVGPGTGSTIVGLLALGGFLALSVFGLVTASRSSQEASL